MCHHSSHKQTSLCVARLIQCGSLTKADQCFGLAVIKGITVTFDTHRHIDYLLVKQTRNEHKHQDPFIITKRNPKSHPFKCQKI